jgi:hypothetical protein
MAPTFRCPCHPKNRRCTAAFATKLELARHVGRAHKKVPNNSLKKAGLVRCEFKGQDSSAGCGFVFCSNPELAEHTASEHPPLQRGADAPRPSTATMTTRASTQQTQVHVQSKSPPAGRRPRQGRPGRLHDVGKDRGPSLRVALEVIMARAADEAHNTRQQRRQEQEEAAAQRGRENATQANDNTVRDDTEAEAAAEQQQLQDALCRLDGLAAHHFHCAYLGRGRNYTDRASMSTKVIVLRRVASHLMETWEALDAARRDAAVGELRLGAAKHEYKRAWRLFLAVPVLFNAARHKNYYRDLLREATSDFPALVCRVAALLTEVIKPYGGPARAAPAHAPAANGDDDEDEPPRLSNYQIRKAVQRAASGQISAAMQILKQDTPPVALDADNIALLQSKMISADNERYTPSPATVAAAASTRAELLAAVDGLTVKALRGALKKIKRGVAVGGSAYTPALLDLMLKTSSGDLNELTARILRLVALADLPDDVRTHFTGGNLTAVPKATGGLRPITPGNVLHKVVEHALLASVEGDLHPAVFAPVQHGVKAKAGLETAAFTVQTMLQAHPRGAAVLIDIARAFDTVNINHVVPACHAIEPLRFLTGYFLNYYGGRRDITYRSPDGTMAAFAVGGGVPQGSVLAPLVYAVLTVAALKSTAEAHPDCTVTAYADDVTVVGPTAERTAAAANHLVQRLHHLDQHVNVDKTQGLASCALRGQYLADADPPSINIDGKDIALAHGPEAGVMLLGMPLGSEDYVLQRLNYVTAQLKLDARRVEVNIPFLQLRHHLLTMSIHNEARHLCRLLNPSAAVTDALGAIDGAISVAAARLVYHNDKLHGWPDPIAKDQAHLRLAQGGLGLIPLRDVHPAAYMAAWGSFVAARDLTPRPVKDILEGFITAPPAALANLVHDFHGVNNRFVNRRYSVDLPANVPELVLYARNHEHAQRDFTAPLNVGRHANFLARLDGLVAQDAGKDLTGTQRRAQYLSASSPGASTWLTALPTHYSLKIDNNAFACAMSLRFGVDAPAVIPPALRGRTCCQEDTAEDEGAAEPDTQRRDHRNEPAMTVAHAVTCKAGARAGPIQRHNDLVNMLATGLAAAGLQTQIEPRGFDFNNSARGPDLLVLMPDNKALVIDMTVRSALAEHVVKTAATEALYACRLAEQEKDGLYKATCDAAGVKLITYAIETTGAVGKRARELNQLLRVAITRAGRQPFYPRTFATPTYLTFLQQQLAVGVVRHNGFIAGAAVRHNQRRLPANRGGLPGNA